MPKYKWEDWKRSHDEGVRRLTERNKKMGMDSREAEKKARQDQQRATNEAREKIEND